MNPKLIIDKAIELVEKANEIGMSIEVALKAFRERLFPVMTGNGVAEQAAFDSLASDQQAVVDSFVAGCQA